MQRSRRALLTLAATFAAAACSDTTPVAPGADADVRLGVQASTGTYAIYFLKETSTGLAPASDAEPVGTYLVLKSEIRDGNGNLAQSGTVTYECCSVGANAAPSSACTSGSGKWKRWGSGQVDPIGTLFGYGSCSTPRTIGFRVTYSGRNSGIANGSSAPGDFSWVAQ